MTTTDDAVIFKGGARVELLLLLLRRRRESWSSLVSLSVDFGGNTSGVGAAAIVSASSVLKFAETSDGFGSVATFGSTLGSVGVSENVTGNGELLSGVELFAVLVVGRERRLLLLTPVSRDVDDSRSEATLAATVDGRCGASRVGATDARELRIDLWSLLESLLFFFDDDDDEEADDVGNVADELDEDFFLCDDDDDEVPERFFFRFTANGSSSTVSLTYASVVSISATNAVSCVIMSSTTTTCACSYSNSSSDIHEFDFLQHNTRNFQDERQ